MSIANNNPFNIEYNDTDKWQGLSSQPQDGKFFSFSTAVLGIRAGFVNLISQQDKHGLNTIRGIIEKLSPPSENKTETYIANVCEWTAFSESQLLNLHSYEDIKPLGVAIMRQECGKVPYSDAQINEALRQAGIMKPTPAFMKDPKVIAGTVVSTTAVAQQVVANTQGIWASLNQMGIGATNVMLGIGVIALSVGALFLLDAWKARKEGRA